MFETLNYFFELSLSLYFLCVYLLFVINVCEFMPLVDHNIDKDDDENDEPSETQMQLAKTKLKHGEDSSSKTGRESKIKARKENSIKSVKSNISSKSSGSKQGKQGIKSKNEGKPRISVKDETIEEPEKGTESAILLEEPAPMENAEDVPLEQEEANQSKLSVKGGSKADMDDVNNENVDPKSGSPVKSETSKKSASISKLSIKEENKQGPQSESPEAKQRTQSGILKKSGSQSLKDVNSPEATAQEVTEEEGLVPVDPEDAAEDTAKKRTKSPDGEDPEAEQNGNPPD